MQCPNCGTEVDSSLRFCPKCGKEVDHLMQVQSQEVDKVPDNLQSASGSMNAQVTSIVAYITWVGFIIAYFAGDREGAKFYLNQALCYHLFSLLCFIPAVGMFWAIFMLVCFILGVMWAVQQNPRELPLIGKLKLLK